MLVATAVENVFELFTNVFDSVTSEAAVAVAKAAVEGSDEIAVVIDAVEVAIETIEALIEVTELNRLTVLALTFVNLVATDNTEVLMLATDWLTLIRLVDTSSATVA